MPAPTPAYNITNTIGGVRWRGILAARRPIGANVSVLESVDLAAARSHVRRQAACCARSGSGSVQRGERSQVVSLIA